jgi:hypothetical protein
MRAITVLQGCVLRTGADLQFEWQAVALSGGPRSISLDPASRNTSALYVPRYTFANCTSARLSVKMWVSSNPQQVVMNNITVQTVRTPYVSAIISGGSYQTTFPDAGKAGKVVLDGSRSLDPDDPGTQWPGASLPTVPTQWDAIEWNCVDTATLLPCWPEHVHQNSHAPRTLTWNISALVAISKPRILRFTLTVENDGRKANASVTLDIKGQPVPVVMVEDVQVKYSPNTKVVLRGVGIPTSRTTEVLVYTWSACIFAASGCIEMDLAAICSTSLTKPTLVVRPDSLVPGGRYRFQLDAADTVGGGRARVVVQVNRPPRGGNVSVVPANGMAIRDTFKIQANGWSDNDIPISYSFGYVFFGVFTQLTPQTPSQSTSVILPVGPASTNFAYNLTGFVTDTFGASTKATGVPVRVHSYQISVGSSMASAATQLLSAAADSGNADQSTQLVQAFAATLNAPSSLAGAAETREVLANVLLSAVGGGGKTLSTDDIAMVGQGIASVCAKPEEMTPTSLASSYAAVEAMASFEGDISVDTVGSLASATSNMLIANTDSSVVPDAAAQKANAKNTKSIVDRLSTALLRSSEPGEPAVLVSTGSFAMKGKKDYAASLEGSLIPVAAGSNVTVKIPFGAFQRRSRGRGLAALASGPDNSAVSMKLTAWEKNPFFFADAPNSSGTASVPTSVGSDVLSVDFGDESGSNLAIQDLEDPFVIGLATSAGVNASDPDTYAFCSYWDPATEEWAIDAAAGRGNITADGTIVCSFSHLTDFGVMIGPPPTFNAPCFSCLSSFLKNPAGIFVVVTCGVLLIASFIVACCRYRRFSQLPIDQVAASTFAVKHQRVMSPDSEVDTGCCEDLSHRFRHDYPMGGICCGVPGDPFDWSQRALVFLTTLIVSLAVSISLFRDPSPDEEPECVNNCTQVDPTAPEVCVETCQEPKESTLYVSLVSAAITTPIMFGLGFLFAWLHKPVVKELTPEKTKLKVVIKTRLKLRKELKKAAKATRTPQSSPLKRAPADQGPPDGSAAPGAKYVAESAANSDNCPQNNTAAIDTGFVSKLVNKAERRTGVDLDGDGDIRVQGNAKHDKAIELASEEAKAALAATGKTLARRGIKLSLDDVKIRGHCKAMVPLCYGFLFGSGGLLLIYGIAANLGARTTKLWLLSAFASLAIKVCLVDPLKVLASVVLTTVADRFDLHSADFVLRLDKVLSARQPDLQCLMDTKVVTAEEDTVSPQTTADHVTTRETVLIERQQP